MNTGAQIHGKNGCHFTQMDTANQGGRNHLGVPNPSGKFIKKRYCKGNRYGYKRGSPIPRLLGGEGKKSELRLRT